MHASAPTAPASWSESSFYLRLLQGDALADVLSDAFAAVAAGAPVPDARDLARAVMQSQHEGGADRTAAHYRQILDGAVDTAIIALDLEGRVTGWNHGARRLLGWEEHEMLGRTLAHVFTPEDQARGLFAKELADALSVERGGHEGWRFRKDGSLFWAIGETTPLRGDDGRPAGFVKVLRDRTAQQQAAEALAEETRALEALNRTTRALARENDSDVLLQIVVDAGVALTGARYGAFFHRDGGSDVHPPAASGASPRALIGLACMTGDPHGSPGIVRIDDMSSHEASRVLRTRSRAAVHVSSYLAVPVISRRGEVLGRLCFAHPDPAVFTPRAEALVSGLAGEAAIAIDNALLFAAAQREIAERTRAEEALRHLNATLEQQVAERTDALRQNAEALRQAQKMEAVGQLTGGVAHDFNNLLQIIVANLELLTRTLPPDAGRHRRAADQAMKGARRAAVLTQQLLAFSRRQPLEPRPVDVNELVVTMSELMLRTLGETVCVETELASDLWQVEADRNGLESALLNLAVNARDAMPRGGCLRIVTSNLHVPASTHGSHAGADAPGDYVVLAVHDTGTGMDEATLAKAFDPFFTTKPVGQGTGLGLSQVYGFVTQSGGHVKVESTLGAGTCVRILMPRLRPATRDASGAAQQGEPGAPIAPPEETILVVEDDEDVRASSVASLRELGYRVLEARDGLTALSVLASEPAVALLFTDVVLPGGMTGEEVADLARTGRPGLKVLFTTGYPRDAIMHGGRVDKGVQLITKPFAFGDLAAKLRDVLDGA